MAHPGHELRVHAWLHRVRPMVFVLTDGSGHSTQSRLHVTTAIVEGAGAACGGVYGRLTDRQAYEALLDGRHDVLLELAEALRDAFSRERFDLVAVDAVEGYNPTHDLCNVIVRAALRSADGPAGFDFPLVGDPQTCCPEDRDRARWIHLSDEELGRKIAAARAYEQLSGDVDAALADFGAEAFRVECLRPLGPLEIPEAPYYEQYGEKQVREGHYSRVLRGAEHFMPAVRALEAWEDSR